LEHEVEQSIQRLTNSCPGQGRFVRTAAAILMLTREFSNLRKLWRRSAAKAMRWLASASNLDVPAVQAWLTTSGVADLRVYVHKS